MGESERSFLGLGGATGFHRIAYTQWGEGHNKRVLICLHGLTRNGRDFDDLAVALSDRWRVLCPDMIGHGHSDWLADPAGYNETQYLNDCVALIARSGAAVVDWVGTSMGGIVGMMLAAQRNAPIRRLVLNDVGPFTPRAALERIRKYVYKTPVFPDLLAAETYLYKTNAPFLGSLTAEQWQRTTRFMTRPHPEGKGYVLHYDPRVALALHAGTLTDMDLWTVWATIRCPVLVLRGQTSDLLTVETTEQMQVRGPEVTVMDIPNCGHAPSLMDNHQIKLIRTFLTAD
ncbi:probable hydrolase [invertebrate metagenome]|uniref:Probable hydrolase n=1 Tax=invertebrate metagenome TaxID=1711999 RepID=A0A484H6K8_9ZZZZ